LPNIVSFIGLLCNDLNISLVGLVRCEYLSDLTQIFIDMHQDHPSHKRIPLPVTECAMSVLQRVAVCCRVLHCAAVCCSVLQYAAECCRVLQCAAVCCSVLQCAAVCCSVPQCVAVCCSVLQVRSTIHPPIIVNGPAALASPPPLSLPSPPCSSLPPPVIMLSGSEEVLTSSSRKCADDAGEGGTRRRVPVCVFMLCACVCNGCVCVCWGGVDE